MLTEQLNHTSTVVSGEEVWRAVLENLKTEFGMGAFNSWFTHLKFENAEGDILIITAPSKFVREWVITNYFKKIREILNSKSTPYKRVDIRVRAFKAKLANDEPEFLAAKNILFSSKLNPHYTFENFVVASSNQLAAAACRAVAQGTNLNKSVVFIHSAVGLGKTHLLQAMANYVGEKYPEKKIAYLSAEKFMHHYIVAVRNNELIHFKEQLRGLDLLLIDDVQFICGKVATQQEFANTLNALSEAGKTVIVSADRSPYELEIDIRSKSRLTGGLVADIAPPDLKHRVLILKSKMKLLGTEIRDDVIDFISKNVTSSIRELEAALSKIATYAMLVGGDLNLEKAKDILKEAVMANDLSISIDKIIRVVSEYFSFKELDVLSKSRESRYVYPRQLIAYLAKQHTTLSLQDIGQKIGKRDHATVIYSVKRLEEGLQSNSNIQRDLSRITEQLGVSCSI